MDNKIEQEMWPTLPEDDQALKKVLEATLSDRVRWDPYSSDGSFAACLDTLPVGLRAMAATHWLDISLTLDSITWHFGNFGEKRLVAQTEAGLIELGLHDLADCFRRAAELIQPLLLERQDSELSLQELIDENGLRTAADMLDEQGWALDNLRPERSVIYEAWIRYTRKYPEKVFTKTGLD